MSYTYKDFATGNLRKTSGIFKGWTNKTGPLNVRYAIFKRPKSTLFIPEYCLTPLTRQILSTKKVEISEDAKKVSEMIISGNY